MEETKKIILSGVKPTGRPHLGNYFGAMKQLVDLQDQYQTFVMIADYHALTTVHDSERLKNDVLNLAIDYLAVGLDPEKVTLFKQSDVPEHTELCWIFNCITAVPYLMRGHAYKAARAAGGEVTVGTFDYPMLMAADILLYDTCLVPVGLDQKQHLEYARDTAEKFNRLFGPTFSLPEPLIPEAVAIVPGTDGRKMSKSYHNTVPLFGEPEELKRTVMAIVTDSEGEWPKNVFALHRLFRPDEALKDHYRQYRGRYQQLKEALLTDIEGLVGPLRNRRQKIAADPSQVRETLRRGGERARARAAAKIKAVRRAVGVFN